MVLHMLVKQYFIYCSHAVFGFIKRHTFLLLENQLQIELEVLSIWVLIFLVSTPQSIHMRQLNLNIFLIRLFIFARLLVVCCNLRTTGYFL